MITSGGLFMLFSLFNYIAYSVVGDDTVPCDCQNECHCLNAAWIFKKNDIYVFIGKNTFECLNSSFTFSL